MKKIISSVFLMLAVTSYSQVNSLNKLKDKISNVQNQGTNTSQNQGTNVSQNQISSALKEALEQGVNKQVVNLTKTDGFLKNSLVKIAVPTELQKVEKGLRAAGLGSLADKGIIAMNRAAEDAVKEAAPIFVEAISKMTITDAKNILMGNNNAATAYLQKSTSKSLYNKFNPVIKGSLSKVGADVVWKEIITTYNTLPLVQKVSPDITEYVTNKTLDGVFTMIGKEEVDIRTNINSRTSNTLKTVFALQDKK